MPLLAALVVGAKIKWLWSLDFCPILSIALQVKAKLYGEHKSCQASHSFLNSVIKVPTASGSIKVYELLSGKSKKWDLEKCIIREITKPCFEPSKQK